MERIRTKFIIAVTQRLAAAADSTAKVELIEELSDNLYSRWQDLTGSGASEEDAYAMALEDLGDVDELLAYLDSLGPEGELPKKEPSMRDFTSELLHGMEGIVRETVSQTKDAVDQAAEIVRNVAEKIKEKYPNGFKGKIYVHVDHDEDAAPEAAPEQSEEPEAQEKKEQGWSFTAGYNRERGGFFCESGQKTASRRVSGTVLPSKEIKAVDVQIVNGDVDIRLGDGPEDDVRLSGDVDHLEVRMSEDGVLSVRQGDTAGAPFFRRLASASEVHVTAEAPAAQGMVEVITHAARVLMPLAELVDIEKEKARLTKDLGRKQGELKGLEGKLSNPGFLNKAPAEVVASEKERAEKLKILIVKIEEQLKAL